MRLEDFEERVKEYFRNNGYTVERKNIKGRFGREYDISIYAEKDGEIAICKCKYGSPAGAEELSNWNTVCEDIAVYPSYASFGGYTEEAKELIDELGFIAIEGSDLSVEDDREDVVGKILSEDNISFDVGFYLAESAYNEVEVVRSNDKTIFPSSLVDHIEETLKDYNKIDKIYRLPIGLFGVKFKKGGIAEREETIKEYRGIVNKITEEIKKELVFGVDLRRSLKEDLRSPDS